MARQNLLTGAPGPVGWAGREPNGKSEAAMMRHSVLILSVVSVCLSGCQMNATCRPHTFRPPGLHGRVYGSCDGHCNGQCRHKRPGRGHAAPLFPGDSYAHFAGFNGGCGDVSCGGCGCGDTMPGMSCGEPWMQDSCSSSCSSCGEMYVNSGCAGCDASMGSGLAGGCQCGQHGVMPQNLEPIAESPAAPQSDVPMVPDAKSDHDESVVPSNTTPNDYEGSVPVPPVDDSTTSSQTAREFHAESPESGLDNSQLQQVPAATPVLDPVSWEIPSLPPIRN
jgi:hypothetical protein